jgi:hypothetical protein
MNQEETPTWDEVQKALSVIGRAVRVLPRAQRRKIAFSLRQKGPGITKPLFGPRVKAKRAR